MILGSSCKLFLELILNTGPVVTDTASTWSIPIPYKCPRKTGTDHIFSPQRWPFWALWSRVILCHDPPQNSLFRAAILLRTPKHVLWGALPPKALFSVGYCGTKLHKITVPKMAVVPSGGKMGRWRLGRFWWCSVGGYAIPVLTAPSPGLINVKLFWARVYRGTNRGTQHGLARAEQRLNYRPISCYLSPVNFHCEFAASLFYMLWTFILLEGKQAWLI